MIRRRAGLVELLAAAGALLALTVLLQYRLGAFATEFGNDDSSSHYVSGLLIHDYLAHWLPGSPLAFVRRFHSSYPIVGIGHWGPGYYVVEGVWMLLSGWGRSATMLLSAVVTTVVALLLYAIGAPRFGRILGGFVGLAYVASPIVQQGSDAVMLDGAITLVCLLAMLTYARYLAAGRPGLSLLYGLLAAAGLLVKGNAACLALLPPLAMAIGRQWNVPRRWSFWLAAPVVILLVGPWYGLTYDQVAAGFRYHWGWNYVSAAVPGNLRILLTGLGIPLQLAGVAGWIAVVGQPPPSADGRLMVTAAALLASVLAFQSVVPAAIQDRYLAPALPPLLLLAAYAVRRAAERWLDARREWGTAIAAAALGVGAFPAVLDVVPHRQFGMVAAAEQVWAERLPANRRSWWWRTAPRRAWRLPNWRCAIRLARACSWSAARPCWAVAATTPTTTCRASRRSPR